VHPILKRNIQQSAFTLNEISAGFKVIPWYPSRLLADEGKNDKEARVDYDT
jgi:hypothetical protein